MRRHFVMLLPAFLCFVLLSKAQDRPEAGPPNLNISRLPKSTATPRAAKLERYPLLPLSFEPRGSEFVARGPGYAVGIRDSHASLLIPSTLGPQKVNLEFEHARPLSTTGENKLPGKINYLLGSDPHNWRLSLATYERIICRDLYPGIDLIYYGNQSQLEFDLLLKPGADLSRVKIRFSGTDKPHVDNGGTLLLGALRLKPPTVTQDGKTIASSYRVSSTGEVTFEVGAYDRRRSLTIDPTLVYATQLGGGDNSNQGNAIALDSGGNIYIAGVTFSDDFPANAAAFGGYAASGDGFISKISADGKTLIYSTYIGGSAYDSLQGIAVDAVGAVWAAGTSASTDFPLLNAYQNVIRGSNDAVVVKLDPNGALLYSTFLGEAGYDIANGIAVDPFGNAYVAGQAGGAGFPTTAGAYQETIKGSGAAFVAKFATTGSLIWSTLLGGTSGDYANAIAVDKFGNSYIAGVSYSTLFPGAPSGGAQTINRGGGDAFIAKLNFNGSALLYFTFLGGAAFEQPNGIAVDPVSGIAVVAGETISSDFPTTTGALQMANAGGDDGFLAKLNTDASAFLYVTYLGGVRNDYIRGVNLDSAGNAYVAGITDSMDFPITSGIQPRLQGNSTSLFHSSDVGATWSPMDATLPGATYDISPDPVVNGAIVASTETGIFRTTNRGGSWTRQSEVTYLRLSRSPANPSVIYGIACNVFQSTDSGVTWNIKASNPPNCDYFVVADPLNPAIAYSYGPSSLQKTIDNGVTWNPSNTGIPSNQNIAKMVTLPDGSLYVALRSAIPGQPSLGVYKSADHGATWIPAKNGLASDFPLGDLAAASNSLYLTDFFTLYRSTDAGASWNVAGSLPTAFVGCIANTLGASSLDSALVYWSPCYFGWGIAGLAASTNAGAMWNPAGGLGVATINSIVPDPLNRAGAYALSLASLRTPFVSKIDPTGQNVLYSTYIGDSGQAWGIAINGTGDAYITGNTYSKAFPVTPTALQGNNAGGGPPNEVFVARISDATSACAFSVTPQPYLSGPYESAVLYSVVAPSGCAWSASSTQPWAKIVSGASGSGAGVVYVLLSVNTTGNTRIANLNIAGQVVTLSQLPINCDASFTPDSSVIPSEGGALTLSVIAGDNCGWNVLNNDPNAIGVVSGGSGTGNGTVILNVQPNLGPNTRTFTFRIQQGGSNTISQAGTTAPAVVSTVTSSPAGAAITVTGAGCISGSYTTPASLTWNANTNCTMNFKTPQNISGASYNFYNASVNGGPTTTINPLTVNSGSSSLTIAASFLPPCTYSLTPSSQGFASGGGLGSFTLNTAPTCAWNVSFGAPWITPIPLFNPLVTTFKGPRMVSFALAANSGPPRSANITAGGQTFAVSQSAFNCSYAIAPTHTSLDDTGGLTFVSVSTQKACPWTAVSNSPWITVKSAVIPPDSTTGGGTVTLGVGSNTGSPRTGTVTIAGQVFSVDQGGGACGALDATSSISPPNPGGFTPDPYNVGTFSQQLTLTNSSGSVIHAPVYVVLEGQPSNGNLVPQPRLTKCFSSTGDYIFQPLQIGTGDFAAGKSVTLYLDWVFGPGFQCCSAKYNVKVLSGAPSR